MATWLVRRSRVDEPTGPMPTGEVIAAIREGAFPATSEVASVTEPSAWHSILKVGKFRRLYFPPPGARLEDEPTIVSAPPMWLVRDERRSMGPIPADVVLAAIDARAIPPHAEIASERDQSTWFPIATHPDFGAAVARLTAPTDRAPSSDAKDDAEGASPPSPTSTSTVRRIAFAIVGAIVGAPIGFFAASATFAPFDASGWRASCAALFAGLAGMLAASSWARRRK